MVRTTVSTTGRAAATGAGTRNPAAAGRSRAGRAACLAAVVAVLARGALPLLGGCATAPVTGGSAAHADLGPEQLAARRIVIASGVAGDRTLLLAPVEGARISSPFGPRDHPVLGGTGERLHHGIDLAAPAGAPVRAAGSGTVIAAGPRGAYGHHVRIRHDDTYETAYAHLADYAQGVGPGRRVRQGEVIGYVGSTGRSTGPHLHYDVLVDGVQVDPLALKPSLATRLKSGTLGAVRAAGAGIGKVGSAVAAAAASVGGPLGRAASLLWDDGTDRRAAAASE